MTAAKAPSESTGFFTLFSLNLQEAITSMSFSNWLIDQIEAAKQSRNHTSIVLGDEVEATISSDIANLVLAMVFKPVPTGTERADLLENNFETRALPYLSSTQLTDIVRRINELIDEHLGTNRHPTIIAISHAN